MFDVHSDAGNYQSFNENREAAQNELRRELKEGYLLWAQNREDLERQFGSLCPARIAAIVKIKKRPFARAVGP